MNRITPVLFLVAATLACTDKKKEEDTSPELTQRQRDSVIGESRLPGAQGVRGALSIADSAAARQKRVAEIN